MSVSALRLEHDPGDLRQSWRFVGVALGVAALVLGGLFSQEIVGAYRVWLNSTAFSHCFLVFPVALYLIWERRKALQNLVPQSDFRFLLLLPVLSVIWLAVEVIGVLEAQQFVLITMVQVILLTVLGRRIYLLLLGPFVYLYLLVPTGEFLVPTLQDITAKFVVFALNLLHVPTFSDGIIISIPEGDFVIAEACAGLRFLIASVAFAGFFALMMYRSWWRRAAFLALAVTVPIVANGIRCWGIVYLAHLTDDVTAVEADHLVYGWGFFSAIILLLIFIGMRFAEGAVAPVPEAAPATSFSVRTPLLATAIAVTLASLGPVYAAYLESARWRPDLSVVAAPTVEAPWQREEAKDDTWNPLIVSPDTEFRDALTSGDGTVQRYVALYAAYGRHNNLVRSPNRIIDGDIWVRTTLGTTRATIDGAPVIVNTAEIRSGPVNRLMWSFYVVDGTVTGSAAEAKLRQARAILAGRAGISAFVIVSTEMSSLPDAHPDQVLQHFLDAMEPLDHYIAAARTRSLPQGS